MLLYKHDDDLRQEMFAIEFIKTCDNILKASGLDMKILVFGCMPVGAKRGFIEWVPGSVPLSDICIPSGASLLGNTDDDSRGSSSRNGLKDLDDVTTISGVAKAGLTKYEYFRPLSQQQRGNSRGSLSNNPIQEYFHSIAYDSDAPYLIQKEVMDTYVKSCAGYCVVTYLLGVGDRHLDNVLLAGSGHIFHCDYSFILGNDPKKYLPMRYGSDTKGELHLFLSKGKYSHFFSGNLFHTGLPKTWLMEWVVTIATTMQCFFPWLVLPL